MSNGLESLENIKGNCDLFDEGYQWDNEFSKQFDEDLDSIERGLKALEIIKGLHVFRFYEDNQFTVTGIGTKTDKETYDLLKEVLL